MLTVCVVVYKQRTNITCIRNACVGTSRPYHVASGRGRGLAPAFQLPCSTFPFRTFHSTEITTFHYRATRFNSLNS